MMVNAGWWGIRIAKRMVPMTERRKIIETMILLLLVMFLAWRTGPARKKVLSGRGCTLQCW